MTHLRILMSLALAMTLNANIMTAKPHSEQLKVACVGNSVTYGYGLSDREHTAYPVRLQQMLGSNFDVRNFGHSGSTLLFKGHRPYVKTEEYRTAMDFKADWVVIHLGLNDTDPRNWPDWKEEFIPNYYALIDSFRTANPKARILICLMSPIFERHPRYQSGTRDWHEQIQMAIRTIAAGAKVQLIDLFTPLHSRPDLFSDALHPNAEGADIIAQTVYSALTGDYGGLSLPSTFSDNMVLQRGQQLRLHGTANADALVSISIDNIRLTAKTTSDGQWEAIIPSHPAGGPYELTVSADKTITLSNVYYGDVWLASGQSNMELMVSQTLSRQQDLADASQCSRLHLLNMPAIARTDAVQWSDSILTEVNQLRYLKTSGWAVASSTNVDAFSSIAFNFGRTLTDSLDDVHIGIICNAVGGSTTESWIDRSTLEHALPNILTNWMNSDYGQAWARGRAAQNVAHALDAESPVFNRLQRHPYDPCYLFEAAIAPLEQFPIKGVLWYQGESNANNLELHARLFRLLEESWRNEWNNPTLPFYMVQLSSLPRPSWPAFRDSQRQLALQLDNTYLTVTTDLGDSLDVHYRNKRPVGERLALQALHHSYGHNIVSEGPTLTHVLLKGETAVLTFDNADGLTATRGFEVAGVNGIYHQASISVSGNTITVSSPAVTDIQSIRYGWRGYTDADMRNSQLLPASTFLVPQ